MSRKNRPTNNSPLDHQEYDVTVVVSAAREDLLVLAETLRHTLIACEGLKAKVYLLVNGNESLAKDVKALMGAKYKNQPVALWFFEQPDKANCWNTYVYALAPKATLHFFIDGYVRPRPDSFRLALDYARANPVLAITGVPTSGRSSARLRQEMLAQGGIHGNLYALTQDSLEKLQAIGFKLPLGIYRTDPLIGAVINFNFDNANHAWNSRGVTVLEQVTWEITPQRWYSYRDLKAQFNRRLRQGRGVLENLAIKNHLAINKRPVRELPVTASDMIANYLQTHPLSRDTLLRHPVVWLAYRKLRKEGTIDLPALLERCRRYSQW